MVPFHRMKKQENMPVHMVVLLLLAKMTNLKLVYTAIAFNHCNEKVAGGVWAYYIVLSISVY